METAFLNVIIVDDEESAREYLAGALTRYCPDVRITGQASNVKEAEHLIRSSPPHLVFLDIEMPRENGFELLKKFEEISFEVVFVTAYEKYAVKAFKLSALDYLLKPIDLDELQHVVRKAAEKIHSKKLFPEQYKALLEKVSNRENPFTRISIPMVNGYEFILLTEIIYLKAESSYTQFFLKGGRRIMATRTLKEFEDILSDLNFYRVHKSSMINLSAMTRYIKGEGGIVQLEEGHEVEVSRRSKEGFVEKLNHLLK